MNPPPDDGERQALRAFDIAGLHVSVDLPHLLFVSAIAGWCAWYWFDAYAAASDIQNLSLIEPTAILALALYLVVLRDCIRIRRAAIPGQAVAGSRKALPRSFRWRIFGTMILLAIYVAVSSTIGFDVSSFLYILATLVFLGERRPLVLILAPAAFCIVAIYTFNTILATPLPLFFGGEP